MNTAPPSRRGIKLAWAVLAGFLLIQLVPLDRHNPPIQPGQSVYAVESVPPQVRAVLERSCSNCHSDETRWPWYSYVAPVSWMVASDVHHARRNMDLSRWATYTAEKREDKLEEICEQITNGDMPDPKYVLFHRRARPTQQEREAVCKWTDDVRQY